METPFSCNDGLEISSRATLTPPSPRVRGEGGVRGPLGWTQNCGKVCNASLQSQCSESRRGPLTLVRGACHRAGHFGPDPLAHSTSPRTRGEVKPLISTTAEISLDSSLTFLYSLKYGNIRRRRGLGRARPG